MNASTPQDRDGDFRFRPTGPRRAEAYRTASIRMLSHGRAAAEKHSSGRSRPILTSRWRCRARPHPYLLSRERPRGSRAATPRELAARHGTTPRAPAMFERWRWTWKQCAACADGPHERHRTNMAPRRGGDVAIARRVVRAVRVSGMATKTRRGRIYAAPRGVLRARAGGSFQYWRS